MKERSFSAAGATIEHFDNGRDFEKKYNVAICCRRCNSSKGTLTLSQWLKKPYCVQNGINEKTVSNAVRAFLRLRKKT
jgi:hypothetical protein